MDELLLLFITYFISYTTINAKQPRCLKRIFAFARIQFHSLHLSHSLPFSPNHQRYILLLLFVLLLLDLVNLLVKLPIVIEVNTIVVMQPNDVDVIVSFGQTTQCNWIVATRWYISGCCFKSCRLYEANISILFSCCWWCISFVCVNMHTYHSHSHVKSSSIRIRCHCSLGTCNSLHRHRLQNRPSMNYFEVESIWILLMFCLLWC